MTSKRLQPADLENLVADQYRAFDQLMTDLRPTNPHKLDADQRRAFDQLMANLCRVKVLLERSEPETVLDILAGLGVPERVPEETLAGLTEMAGKWLAVQKTRQMKRTSSS